jgi:hypothetical protein
MLPSCFLFSYLPGLDFPASLSDLFFLGELPFTFDNRSETVVEGLDKAVCPPRSCVDGRDKQRIYQLVWGA